MFALYYNADNAEQLRPLNAVEERAAQAEATTLIARLGELEGDQSLIEVTPLGVRIFDVDSKLKEEAVSAHELARTEAAVEVARAERARLERRKEELQAELTAAAVARAEVADLEAEKARGP